MLASSGADDGTECLQDGCEFLVASLPDGCLDLRDVYVLDQGSGIYARPATHGAMPDVPTKFQEILWRIRYDGDMIKYEEPWEKVQKVYLVEIQDEKDYTLNLERVYCLDSEKRELREAPVERLPGSNCDPTEQILRITDKGLVLDGRRTVPTAEDIIHEWEKEHVWAKPMDDSESGSLQSGEEDGQVARDPLDRLRDFNDAAIAGGMDIPAADEEDFE